METGREPRPKRLTSKAGLTEGQPEERPARHTEGKRGKGIDYISKERQTAPPKQTTRKGGFKRKNRRGRGGFIGGNAVIGN